MNKHIPPALSGVFAALPTPYQMDGTPDVGKLEGLLDFHLGRKIPGVCVGGVTGEYATCGVEHRLSLFQTVSRCIDGRATLVCGIGAEHRGQVRRLACAAADCGAVAALLSPPSFFKHRSSDMLDFIKEVAADLPLPVLFYNIPQFTSGLSIEDVLRLVDSVPNVIGLKDSSGVPENLPILRKAKEERPMSFFMGSDGLLVKGLSHGADGAISGLSAACPDLVLAIYAAFRAGREQTAGELQSMLDEFIAHLGDFPPPWAIKLALEARGVEIGDLNWSLGKHLQARAEEFQSWFKQWIAKADAACSSLTFE